MRNTSCFNYLKNKILITMQCRTKKCSRTTIPTHFIITKHFVAFCDRVSLYIQHIYIGSFFCQVRHFFLIRSFCQSQIATSYDAGHIACMYIHVRRIRLGRSSWQAFIKQGMNVSYCIWGKYGEETRETRGPRRTTFWIGTHISFSSLICQACCHEVSSELWTGSSRSRSNFFSLSSPNSLDAFLHKPTQTKFGKAMVATAATAVTG